MRRVVSTVLYASGGSADSDATTSPTVARFFAHSTCISGNSPSVRLSDFFLPNASSKERTIKKLIVRDIYNDASHRLSIIKLRVWSFGECSSFGQSRLGCP